MAQIAGLKDFRQVGPPADIGTFQFAATAMVFKFTFSGTTYTVAMASGVDGWTLIAHSPANNDEDVEIQAAITYVNTLGGGSVVILQGTFLTSSTIYLMHHVWVVGASIHATVVRLAADSDCNVFEWSPTDDEAFAGLFNMFIDGNKVNNAAGHCLFCTNADGGDPKDFHSSHVWYNGAAEDGVHLDYGWGYKFTNCLYEYNTGVGYYTNGDQTTNYGFYSAENGSHGVHIDENAERNALFGESSVNDGSGISIEGSNNYGVVRCASNDFHGFQILAGNYNNFRVTAFANDAQATATYYNISIYGSYNHVNGTARTGTVAADVYMCGGVNYYWGIFDTIAYCGWAEAHAQVVNGAAVNDGDPDAAGQWNGVAKQDGLIIRDITNDLTYLYDSREAGGRYTI